MYDAVDVKRREQWDHWSYALSWVVNAMPNMSGKARRPIHPDTIHPYKRNQICGGIALRTSNPMAEAALDAWQEAANARRS